MNGYMVIIFFFWVVFFLVWFVLALRAKKSRKDGTWWRQMGFRLVILGVLLALIRIPQVKESVKLLLVGDLVGSPAVSLFGVVLSGLGFAFAIWARFCLGKEWGQPMTMREKPTLVTTGPYAFVRHPIYTGIGTAWLGTGLVIGPIWYLPFIVMCVYFYMSAKTEEKNMAKEFPKEYPAYVHTTKMFVPRLI